MATTPTSSPTSRSGLIAQAHIAEELEARYLNNRILYYKSCSEKHTAFHRSNANVRVIFGGNRSGKSVAGLTELLFHACMKKHPFSGRQNRIPGSYRIFCSDFGVIEKLILPMLRDWIPLACLQKSELGRQGAFEASYDSRYHIITLKNGTTIDMLSYDQDSSKSESVELDGAWADEEMPERLYSATLARLVSRRGRFWMTVTPLYSLTWAMSFLESDDPNIETYQLSIYDNPHLSTTAIADFINTIPDIEKEARVHGRFMEFQGLVYKELLARKDAYYVVTDAKLPYFHWPVVMAMDPHPRKATVVTWAWVGPQGEVVFFDELEMKGTAKEIVDTIRAKESVHRAQTTMRLIDPAARAQGSNIASQTDTLREFEKEGMGFTLADNSEAGYNIVHEYLAWDADRELSPLNKPMCQFTHDVPRTWQAMTHLLWDEWNFTRTLRDEKEKVKDYKKDFPDCVRYTLAFRPRFVTQEGPAMLRNVQFPQRSLVA